MRGKKIITEQFNEKALSILGDRYTILNEYTGSNSYIEVYHKDCDHTSKIRANRLLSGSRCKCERINPFAKDEVKNKIKHTNLERYGTEHPMQNDTIKNKAKLTNLERYGVENTFQCEASKNKLIEKYDTYNIGVIRNLPEIKDRLNMSNPFTDDEVKSKIKQIKLERYGDEYYNNHEKATNTSLERYGGIGFGSDNISNKIKLTMKELYGVELPGQSKEIRAKCVKTAKNTKSKIDGTKFDSSYERDLYDFCLRNNIEIEDTQVPITFEYDGKNHTTFIDFKINGNLFECKGAHLLDGVFDYKQQVPISKKIEIYKENHVILITNSNKRDLFNNSNGLKYLDKCSNPLIGIDINLFNNPEFPYREDRPKCFYNVKVDNNPSMFEAFNDEYTRWRMIMNRINYVGGFIDSKSVITAMNVTRTSKQPSWFSKRYAKDLINKYISTDTILDPFAGWGARCDAALELKKEYIRTEI